VSGIKLNTYFILPVRAGLDFAVVPLNNFVVVSKGSKKGPDLVTKLGILVRIGVEDSPRHILKSTPVFPLSGITVKRLVLGLPHI
jgi:hypothetical protein